MPAFPPIPQEVLALAGIDAGVFARRAFDFSSPDGIWKISLASEFLALTSTKYSRWEDFRKRLESITGILVDTYQIPRFERVGLRYRDLIRRSDLGVDGQPWSTLLRRELLGELVAAGFEGLEQDAEGASREIVIRLDHPSEKVRLYHGFARLRDSEEVCYLVDADFFREGQTEKGDVREVLDKFNKQAGRLFRWCIGPGLHQAMGPEVVP